MVNTGKPSKGCYLCRARRIKCDEAKPSCMRCQKSKRICPGYRDAFELNLRDQTPKIAGKRKPKTTSYSSFWEPNQNIVYKSQCDSLDTLSITIPESSSLHDTSPTWSFSSGTHSSRESISSSSSVSTRSPTLSTCRTPNGHIHHGFIRSQLHTPIDQQAACFFLANFVLVPARGIMRGYMDFLLPLLKEKPDPCLSAAFSAVALAALATRPNSRALVSKVDLSYAKALNTINASLKDSRTASSASTLVAVLLMTYFEQLTTEDRSQGTILQFKQQAWNSHVDGAVAILKARGPEGFQSSGGRGIWQNLRSIYTLQCIAQSKDPTESIEWWMSVPADCEWTSKFARLNILVARLRAENSKTTILMERNEVNCEKVSNLLRSAEDLDNELDLWFRSLPALWKPRSEAWINDQGFGYATSKTHPGRMDSYSEMWYVYHQNIGRSSRILIWTTIIRCVAWLGDLSDYRLTPQYIRGEQICRQQIEDIVASCPYVFGFNTDVAEAMVDQSAFACGSPQQSSGKLLWGIFLLWPLFVASSSDFALPSQRLYMRGRLTYISGSMGISQAEVLLKAPLVHPSLYIERERRNIHPHTCLLNGPRIELTAEIAKPPIALPDHDPSASTNSWVQAQRLN